VASTIGGQHPAPDPTPERPLYAKVREAGRNLWIVTIDEGWRSTILCSGMYEEMADWLIGQIQGKPVDRQYAPLNAETVRLPADVRRFLKDATLLALRAAQLLDLYPEETRHG
jgi:hypothetical protein